MGSYIIVAGCVFFALLHAAMGEWCLHQTTDSLMVYNITKMQLGVTGPNGRNWTMNSCSALKCSTNTQCQICQWGSNCVAASYGGMYTTLPFNYTAQGYNTGYTMFFYGDVCGGRPRESTVYVLCGQNEDRMVLIGELTTCRYYFELRLKDKCSFVPPPPSLTKLGQTSSSAQLQITSDPALTPLDFERSYTVTMDGDTVYHGIYETFEVALPKGKNVSFQVVGQYGAYQTAISSALLIPTINKTNTEEELIFMQINSMQGQLNQLTQMNQQLQTQMTKMEQQLSVDLLPVVRHADDQTVEVSSKVDTLGAQISNTPSSSGFSGGFAVLFTFVGTIVGLALTLLAQKFVLPHLSRRGGGRGGYFSTPMNTSIVDDEL